MRFLYILTLSGLLPSLLIAVEPKPAITKLDAFPVKIAIRGADDAPQISITGTRDTGRPLDLTAEATYTVSDPKVLRVEATGRIFPVGNGTAEITATFGTQTTKISVDVKGTEAAQSINFANQISPVLTKLGCNSGGCHGKISGQNGFRLSLLGFEPELDYMTLLKESRGRRLMPASPDQSLFLLKGAGIVAHGGGKKMDVASEEYKLLRRWIAAGMPYGQEKDPKVARVTVFPESRVIDRKSHQQLVVHAHYTDGTIEDVTRRAQYESNETEVASVSELEIGRAHV